jgi:peptidoglycan/xylan/chitin deacetylase (PgdA/CDA1 family)
MRDILRLYRGLRGMLTTHYPNFALGMPLGPTETPIFIYHDVTSEEFGADLQFLRRNGYRTLSLREFFERADGKGKPEKAVLITFDDARKTFYTEALPALRAFGARATLFAPTYWMMGEANSPETSRHDLFMSWMELRRALDSGLVDVQSHGSRHALVCVSNKLLGFATPAMLNRFDIYDWPMRHQGGGDVLGRPLLGTPVYDSSPLLSASNRYIESTAATHACVEMVAREGGDRFFSQKGWSQALRSIYERALGREPGRQLPKADFRSLVASEFEQSRDEFRRHLGYEPDTMAYPWKLGSPLSLELAARFGLKAVFGVALDYRRARSKRLPVRVFGRLKCDWLPTLPGDGRLGLTTVAARKLCGFSKTLHLAH